MIFIFNYLCRKYCTQYAALFDTRGVFHFIISDALKQSSHRQRSVDLALREACVLPAEVVRLVLLRAEGVRDKVRDKD